MSTPKRLIRSAYGIDFPESFFEFRDFAESLPRGLLHDAVGVRLEAPFELATGTPAELAVDLEWRSRHYNDPPELPEHVASGATAGGDGFG